MPLLKEKKLKMSKLVIFDLDGTLVDTLPDISVALNTALKSCGYEANYSLDEIKSFIGSGEYLLIKRSLIKFDQTNEDEIKRVRNEYSKYYHEHCNINSLPYSGIIDELNILKQNGYQLAVLSNKPHSETTKVVKTYFPTNFFNYVRGGVDGFPIKPNPLGIKLIFKELNIQDSKDIYYVGDSNVDMETGLNAKLITIGTAYGYCQKEVLESYPVYKVIDSPKQLSQIILNT